jgi:hypothetical protein
LRSVVMPVRIEIGEWVWQLHTLGTVGGLGVCLGDSDVRIVVRTTDDDLDGK